VLALLLLAVALGLSNFAAAIGIGVSGVRGRARVQIAVVFGAVSVIMTLAGLELGARLGASAGERSELIASVMLIAVGIAVAAGVF
jgi:manganese efflux pump family protein